MDIQQQSVSPAVENGLAALVGPDGRPTRKPKVKTMVELWKAVTIALFGVIVTGSASYLAMGRDRVTRSELEHYVESNSPYARDKSLIMQGLLSGKEQLDHANAQVQQMAVNQATLGAKVDQLLLELRRLRDELRKPPKDCEGRPGGKETSDADGQSQH